MIYTCTNVKKSILSCLWKSWLNSDALKAIFHSVEISYLSQGASWCSHLDLFPPHGQRPPRDEQGQACPIPTLNNAETSLRGQVPTCPMPTLSKALPDLPRVEACLRGTGTILSHANIEKGITWPLPGRGKPEGAGTCLSHANTKQGITWPPTGRSKPKG